MLVSHYIISDKLKKDIEEIIKLGKSQNGVISHTQLGNYVGRESNQDYKRRIILDALQKNKIKVSTNYRVKSKNEERHDFIKKYYIDEERVDFSQIKQIDECLTYEDFCSLFDLRRDNEYFVAKRLNLGKYKTLAAKINHVENCPHCSHLVYLGHCAMNHVYGTFMPNPEENLAKELEETYSEWLEDINAKKKQCEEKGHTFTNWEHDVWVSRWNRVVDYGLIKNAETRHDEWIRTCTKCNLVEKCYAEPKEVKQNKNKSKSLRMNVNN